MILPEDIEVSDERRRNRTHIPLIKRDDFRCGMFTKGNVSVALSGAHATLSWCQDLGASIGVKVLALEPGPVPVAELV